MNIETDKTDKVKRLNLRQQKFVDHYLSTGNATRAADYAGYAHPNHQAFRLLLNNSVKTHIEEMRSNMAKDSEERRADWVLQLEQLGASNKKGNQAVHSPTDQVGGRGRNRRNPPLDGVVPWGTSQPLPAHFDPRRVL